MITSNEDRIILIKYRLQQANQIIDEITFLIENNKLLNAVNRIYYGIFYSITALALLYKFETAKHKQLIGWFNKNFIANQLLDKKHGRTLKFTYENRQKGDY